MIEKLIYLDAIDLVEFLGVKNSKLELIKNRFPKLKIVGRGNWLKAVGDDEEVARFEEKVNELLEHYGEFNVLTDNSLIDILSGGGLNQMRSGDQETIVFGINGRPIKPRSENQRLMVEAAEKNDMLFAIGPAGSGKTYLAIALAVKAL